MRDAHLTPESLDALLKIERRRKTSSSSITLRSVRTAITWADTF